MPHCCLEKNVRIRISRLVLVPICVLIYTWLKHTRLYVRGQNYHGLVGLKLQV